MPAAAAGLARRGPALRALRARSARAARPAGPVAAVFEISTAPPLDPGRRLLAAVTASESSASVRVKISGRRPRRRAGLNPSQRPSRRRINPPACTRRVSSPSSLLGLRPCAIIRVCGLPAAHGSPSQRPGNPRTFCPSPPPPRSEQEPERDSERERERERARPVPPPRSDLEREREKARAGPVPVSRPRPAVSARLPAEPLSCRSRTGLSRRLAQDTGVDALSPSSPSSMGDGAGTQDGLGAGRGVDAVLGSEWTHGCVRADALTVRGGLVPDSPRPPSAQGDRLGLRQSG